MKKNFRALRSAMPIEHQEQAAARTKRMLKSLALRELRKTLNLTQEQVAESLKVNQAAVSQLEHQRDLYVSTLARYIQALGGELKMTAVFPDREVLLNQFGTISAEET